MYYGFILSKLIVNVSEEICSVTDKGGYQVTPVFVDFTCISSWSKDSVVSSNAPGLFLSIT